MFGRGTRVSAAGRVIRQQLWIPPLLGLIGLVFAGTWVRGRIETSMQDQQREQLRALLNADVNALEVWMRSQEADITSATRDPEIRSAANKLFELANTPKISNLKLSEDPARVELQTALAPWLDEKEHAGYVLVTPDGRIVAADNDTLIGQQQAAGFREILEKVQAGEAIVTRPFPSVGMIKDEWGEMSIGVPTMFAVAPLQGNDGKFHGALGLRIWPEQDFTRILNVARFGQTGETYAFDAQGTLLSGSRFPEQLKQLGLQRNQQRSRSVLEVQVRDPGVDLTTGERSPTSREQQPLTRMAEQAIELSKHTTGNQVPEPVIDVDGYRDYRGSPTIGAATWLPRYGFGVITEIDKGEAYQPFAALRTAFWTLFALLGAFVLLLLGSTWFARRLERRMREAVIAAGKVGQYALEEKIGEGGMGSVFRGRHALLRRPTAVKLLEPSKTTDVSIARFEREVQLTSQLNHPNTITIYDYGRTDEGVFYYAMEYIDGLSLESLVERYGAQPDGRVIHLLLQVCGSLIEAHAQGLIHRDIKPANIMLTRRGGVCDYVKLLDFGLVKAIDSQRQRTLTAADAITGTPLYLPPESIADSDRADARSDLYSLGGVAYFLLTGHPVFDKGSVMDIIRQQLEAAPMPPTQRTSQAISPDLEHLILRCLAKLPSERPQSAAEMAAALSQMRAAQPWTAEMAAAWWHQFDAPGSGDPAGTATQTIALARTLGYSEVDRQP